MRMTGRLAAVLAGIVIGTGACGTEGTDLGGVDAVDQEVFGHSNNAPYTGGYWNYPQILWTNLSGDGAIEAITSRLRQVTPGHAWWWTLPVWNYASHWRAVGGAGNKILWWRSDTREVSLHTYSGGGQYASHRTVVVPPEQGKPVAIALDNPYQCRGPDHDGYLVMFDRTTSGPLFGADVWVVSQSGVRTATRTVPSPAFRTMPVAFGLGVVAGANTHNPTTRAWAVWAHYTSQFVCDLSANTCNQVTTITGYEINDLDLDAATGRYSIRTRFPIFQLANALSSYTPNKDRYTVTGFGTTARDVISPYDWPVIKNYLTATDGAGNGELIEISTGGVPVPSGNRRLYAPDAARGRLSSFSGEAYEGCALDLL
jgi:hypothetical protein